MDVGGCLAIVEFVPADGARESGKVLADITGRVLGERGTRVVGRPDTAAFLQTRRIALPKQRDIVTMSALGQSMGAAAVLDGTVLSWSDGVREPGSAVDVEILLRLISVSSHRILWQGTGHARGNALFRFQRVPFSEVSEKAVRRALGSLAIAEGAGPACTALASAPLVEGPAAESIVAQAPSDAGAAAPLRIVRNFAAATGEKRSIDISEVRVLHFNSETAALEPGMDDLLTEISAILRDNPDLRLLIEGHSDADPKQPSKLRFDSSYQRAHLVYDGLRTAHDVDPRRMMVQAAGEKSPVAPNDTRFNRTLNRRVEFKFLTSGQ